MFPADRPGGQAVAGEMRAAAPHRGGAPVGYVAELGPVEAGAMLYLRLWCDGPDAQSKIWKDFATLLGPQHGRKVLKSFKALCDLCVRHGRRPLMRHHVICKCLGADESCFANFIGYANEGEREDAPFDRNHDCEPGHGARAGRAGPRLRPRSPPHGLKGRQANRHPNNTALKKGQ